MKERNFLKLELGDEAHAKFMALLKKRGITQIAAGTRIVRWFMIQKDTAQQAILLQLPESLKDEAIRQLREGIVQVLVESEEPILPVSTPASSDSAIPEAVAAATKELEKKKRKSSSKTAS